MWVQLGIRYKVLLLFFLLSIIPLASLNAVWLRYSQGQLKIAAADRQSVLVASIAQRINIALDSQIDAVVSTSQDGEVISLEPSTAQSKLLQYANETTEVRRVVLTDRVGKEVAVIEDGAVQAAVGDSSTSEAFEVVRLVSNRPLVSAIKFDEAVPYVTVSVPILTQGNLGDQSFTTIEALARRFSADIRGALIVDISIEEIWTLVSEAKLGDSGYMYLVDSGGRVLIHPNQELTTERRDLSSNTEVKDVLAVLREFDLDAVVKQFKPDPTISTSETGVAVLSSSFPISQTRWGLVAQEPISSVYNSVNRIAVTALTIFLIAVPLMVLLVLGSARTIIRPIRQLSDGVIRMSSGDFSHQINIRGKDELALLAGSFNAMSSNLQALLGRLRAQNATLETEHVKLQAVLNTMSDGVIVLDGQYRIVLTNRTMASFVRAKDSKELYGQSWLSVFNLLYEEKLFTNEQLKKGDVAYFHDLSIRIGDEQRYLDMTAARIYNDPSGIVFILTVQDITPRRELENMKLDFVSMAAHELRTPLTAISGYLKLIDESDTTAEDRSSYIDLASNNTRMLEGLINNMLALSRIERHSLVIHKLKLNWTELVREEVHSFQFMASTKSIELITQVPDETLFVKGDDMALREVLGNLINNAVHYSEDNQKVTVTIERTGNSVKTTVSDHGIGIPEPLHSKLFTKYYRAKGGLTTNSQGTGIGLFISKSIVEAHGGKIDFTSTFGQGSNFYFILEEFKEGEDRQQINSDGTIMKGEQI